MFAVALTGGIASGKSAATHCFAEHGIDVIDADQIARQCVVPGSQAYQAIIAHFGKKVIRADQSLNRAALRQIIFNSKKERLWLEALLHPLIRDAIQQQRDQATSPYCLIVIPLLVESKTPLHYDRVCVVDVKEDIQKQRLLQRESINTQLASAMLDSQASREQRLRIADDIIDNNGSLDALKHQVDALHTRYLTLASTEDKLP